MIVFFFVKTLARLGAPLSMVAKAFFSHVRKQHVPGPGPVPDVIVLLVVIVIFLFGGFVFFFF